MTTILSASRFPPPSASLHDQYPSNPPAALTVVLSIVCGIVATCILFTIVLLLLRHRSCKQAFRQGQQHPRRNFFASNPKSGAGIHVPVVDDGSGSAPDSEDREITIYLPVLHSGSPSTQSKTKTNKATGTHARGSGRSEASGRIPSLAYPNAVYLGLPRTDTMASFPSHVV